MRLADLQGRSDLGKKRGAASRFRLTAVYLFDILECVGRETDERRDDTTKGEPTMNAETFKLAINRLETLLDEARAARDEAFEALERAERTKNAWFIQVRRETYEHAAYAARYVADRLTDADRMLAENNAAAAAI